jgi:hypothetical protein
MPPRKLFNSSQRIFDSPEYRKWRKEVRKRDNYQCQFPNCSKRTKIQCHHIQKWADNSFLRFSKDNGICLCKEHHDFIKGKEEVYAPLFINIVQQKTREQLQKKVKK